MALKLIYVIRYSFYKEKVVHILGRSAFLRIFDREKKEEAKAREVSRIVDGEAVGKPMTQATGKVAVDPALCQHPNQSMKRRGNNKAKWWTCSACQSRWVRVPIEEISAVGPIDDFPILFGKHTGKTFSWVYENDKYYSEWVMKTAEQEASHASAPLKMFAQYIAEREYAEAMAATGGVGTGGTYVPEPPAPRGLNLKRVNPPEGESDSSMSDPWTAVGSASGSRQRP